MTDIDVSQMFSVQPIGMFLIWDSLDHIHYLIFRYKALSNPKFWVPSATGNFFYRMHYVACSQCLS